MIQWLKPRKDQVILALVTVALATLLIILLRVGFAAAQEALPTKLDTDPGSFAQDMYTAFTAKEWGIFVGCLIMFLVWFIRLFVLVKLPSDWLPWVASGMGVLLSIGVDLTSKVPWWKAVLNGLLVGAAASGLWSQVGKKVLPTERKKGENQLDTENLASVPQPLRKSPKIIIAKETPMVLRDTKLDRTRAMSEEEVKKILEDDDTEPYRKALPDDPK